MKFISMTMTALILSQALMSSAWADLACEKKHKQALGKLVAVAQTVSDADLKAILIKGKDSGIDIIELGTDEARMASAQAAADAKSGEINAILDGVNCQTSVKQIEQLKKFFKAKDYTKAVRVLNAMKGFNGLTAKVNQAIAAADTAPAPEQVAVDEGDEDDGNSEVVRPQRPAVSEAPVLDTRQQYTMVFANDGLPIISREHPIVPKKGSFHYSKRDFGTLPAGLSRFKLQQIFLGRASIVDGEYVQAAKPQRERRCNFFVRTNCVK